jgi:tRNA G46 methylase TrmB
VFIKNTNNENFVEIGSGYSTVTRYMAKNYKCHKMIAIEINLLLVYAMRILNIFKKSDISNVLDAIYLSSKCVFLRRRQH